jgi:ABC-type multidrug transport system fused ATPase/permease subunit
MIVNTNHIHQNSLSQKERIVVFVTDKVGTFECAILFAGIGIASIIGILTGNYILGVAVGAFSSYFLQLVMLPLISIRQNLDQRHAEMVADETYKAALQEEADTQEVLRKLEVIIKQTQPQTRVRIVNNNNMKK